MLRLFLIILICLSAKSVAQTVSGIVTDEDQNPLPAVVVINIQTEKKVSTTIDGEFSIEASPNQELRFVRSGFERKSKIITQLNLSAKMNVSLIKRAQEIEEVEIKQKLSGDLKIDNKYLGPPKNEVALNNKIREYHRQKSDISVMKAKSNEFVQPKGPGFEATKIGFKWETFDFFLYLESNLGKDYFYSLGLTNLEIQPFVLFALADFEKFEILRFGYCSAADLARFQVHAEKKILVFKNKK
mgnify:FL=1